MTGRVHLVFGEENGPGDPETVTLVEEDDLDGQDPECYAMGCDEKLVWEDEETEQYVCQRCGAEWFEDKEQVT